MEQPRRRRIPGLARATSGGIRWVDVGCGTGALSEATLEQSGSDIRRGRGAFRRLRSRRLGNASAIGATVHQAPAERLPLPDGAARASSVSGLVLNFIPDLPTALAEMKRVATDGIVAAYVWDYTGGMQMLSLFWDAADEVDPNGSPAESRRFPLCRPDALIAAFEGAGLQRPEVAQLDIPTQFADFEDFWTPFLGGQGAGPSYLVALDADKQAAIRESLRRRVFPRNPDGSISLTARAWAIRASVWRASPWVTWPQACRPRGRRREEQRSHRR